MTLEVLSVTEFLRAGYSDRAIERILGKYHGWMQIWRKRHPELAKKKWYVSTSNRLCYTCRNCYSGCNWSARFEPVEGWVAKPHKHAFGGQSYHILYCPEWEWDGRTEGEL